MEDDVWLRAVLADIGTSPPSDRVIPGWVLLAPTGPLEIVGRLVEMITTGDGDAVAGAFTVLRELGVRPDELWPGDADAEAAATTWAEGTRSAAPAAITYAASLARLLDAPLLKRVAMTTSQLSMSP